MKPAACLIALIVWLLYAALSLGLTVGLIWLIVHVVIVPAFR